MPGQTASFIDFTNTDESEIYSLFDRASEIKRGAHFDSAPVPHLRNSRSTAALLFFEPSTRTRMSFETACHRLGLHPLLLDTAGGTSLEKGESVEDSILNVAAMEPEILIVRSNEKLDMNAMSKALKIPILNAGWGAFGHPTQALLDVFTLIQKWGGVRGKRLLLVGDIRFSRVAASHFQLAQLLGYEVAICGPSQFLPENSSKLNSIQSFDSLSEGQKWCDAIMMLRFQFERHSSDLKFSSETIKEKFGLHKGSLLGLKKDSVIMHPGPVHHGIEMDQFALSDSRSVVLEQVTNGVFVRQALILKTLERSV